MPSIPKKVNVIKVPKSQETLDTPVMPEFQRMPRMYLELLENKDKIKPNLVNKEYDPDDANSVYSFDVGPKTTEESFVPASTIPEENEEETESEQEEPDTSSDASGATSSSIEQGDDQDEEEENSVTLSVASSSSSSSSHKSSSRKSDSRVSSSSSHQTLSDKEKEIKNETKRKLKDLLFSEEPAREVPKLSELKQRGEVKNSRVIADLNRTVLENEDELKRELLFKFEVLKKSYKNINIPEFTMHSDYRNMNQTYENTLRQVSLDSNVDNYKSLLVAGFMVLEFILGFWLKFDMSGFTQQQILNMTQYERLLIELGEKSYVPGGSQWPVELRLLGLVVMNAIIFIISKMILKKTGSNLVGLMNSVNTMMNPATQKPKRRMRGPNVDLDAIPEVQ